MERSKMTDVQVEVGLSQTKRKRKRAQKRPQPQLPQIKYDDAAIAQGIRLVKALKSSEMKLGELSTVAISPHHIGLVVTKHLAQMVAYFSTKPAWWRKRFILVFSAGDQRWFERRWQLVKPLAGKRNP
jgi:hypothetical protein